MSRLIARLLLAILMFPLAAVFDLIVYILIYRRVVYNPSAILWSLILTWFFVGIYWVLLWRGSITWTSTRILQTLLAAVVASMAGYFVGTILIEFERDVATFCGGAATILLWVVGTIFVWRESQKERAERLRGSASGVVCPNCGYNLTGLTATRCPECGAQHTLDELFASQPNRATTELETR